MSLIDKLDTVKDKESFVSFATELAKERAAKSVVNVPREINIKEIENYVRTVLAWAESSEIDPHHQSNPASVWRRFATSIYCRK